MDHKENRDEHEAASAKSHSETLESTEISGARRADDRNGGQDDAELLRQAEIAKAQRDADEFGDDGQGVQNEEIDDAEGAPEFAEPLEDQAGVTDPGHSAKAQNHLLIDIEDRDERQQRPEQRDAVVLAGLGIGSERAGVIVADHDDEARTEDCEQRRQLAPPAAPRAGVVMEDCSERAVDVANMGLVEDGGLHGVV